MKIFNTWYGEYSHLPAFIHWEVATEVSPLAGKYYCKAVLDITICAVSIRIHNHYEDTALSAFMEKIQIIEQELNSFIQALPLDQEGGQRTWLNSGNGEAYMLGSVSWAVVPEEAGGCYKMFTIADCSRRLFIQPTKPGGEQILQHIRKVIATILTAISYVQRSYPIIAYVGTQQAADGQATAD
jgi:hypothetical protein